MDTPSPPTAPDVLVTGSAGHLGAALMLGLPAVGFNPLGIDILPSTTTHQVGSITDRVFVGGVLAAHPSIQHVLHAAALHVPHLASHSIQDFIDVNVTGTQIVLEAAQTLPDLHGVVFLSTTNTYGAASAPPPEAPAVWLDESTATRPNNIYGVTKCAAENLCYLAHKSAGLPILILRLGRFFEQVDIDATRRAAFANDNLKVLELSHRRCDIADVVLACQCAMRRAQQIQWGTFLITAPTPFRNDAQTLQMLGSDAQAALQQAVPEVEAAFRQRGWNYLTRIDRVYDSSKAVRELGWQPVYTFERAVKFAGQGKEWRSELMLRVQGKAYHAGSASAKLGI